MIMINIPEGMSLQIQQNHRQDFDRIPFYAFSKLFATADNREGKIFC